MSKNNEGEKLFQVLEDFAVVFGKGLYRISECFFTVAWMGTKRSFFTREHTTSYIQLVAATFVLCLGMANNLHFFGVLPPFLIETAVKIGLWYCLSAALIFSCLSVLFVVGLKPFREKVMLQNAIDDLGFETKTGKKPTVVSVEYKGELKKNVIIESVGIGPSMYQSKLDNFQSATKWIIDDIQRSPTNSTHVVIRMTEKALPKRIDFNDVVEKITRPYQIILGRSLSGMVSVVLEDLPHLLIAGATGGGKSNALNVILMSLLRYSKRLKVYCIDLKIVELNPYKKFPCVKVADTLADALATLKHVESEMNRRYRYVLSERGYRKMEPKRDNLDRIVVVMDECSDVLAKVNRSSEDYQQSLECKDIVNILARKGRAAGIHLILATQRVSKETLDSRIVGNMTSKICFRMTSVSDSSLVLNSKAAYDLPKIPGRAYWSNGNTLEQIQVPYIGEEEFKREAEIAEHEGEEKQDTKEKNELSRMKFNRKWGRGSQI